MKTKSHLFLALPILLLATTVNAQLKVHSTGNISIGGDFTPGARLHVLGDATFSASPPGNYNSAPLIRGAIDYSNAGNPDYTWFNNTTTGIFHPEDAVVGISSGGVEKVAIKYWCTRFSDKALFSSQDSPQSAAMIMSTTNFTGASNPDYTWSDDTKTGIFHPENAVVGISSGGVEKVAVKYWCTRFSDKALFSSQDSPQSAAMIMSTTNFTGASNPDYTWSDDTKTGIFHPGSGIIGFSNNLTGGSGSMRIIESGHILMGTDVDDGWFKLNIHSDNSDRTTDGCLMTTTFSTEENSYAHLSIVKAERIKNWAIRMGENDNFWVYGNGDIYVRQSYFSSDENLKTNIKPIESIVELNKLQGVTFDWIADKDKTEQFGFIAQEVEKIFPSLVATTEGKKAVNYIAFIPMLVEAYKQQSKQIKELNDQLLSCCSSSVLKTDNSSLSHSEQSASLDQNIPNPFNSETVINCFIPENSKNSLLIVFNMNGDLIKQFAIAGTGKQSFKLQGKELNPGMYLYALVIDGKEIDTKKMILTK